MKQKKLLTTTFLLAGSALAGTALINKAVFVSATKKNILNNRLFYSYRWRLGDIKYLKTGKGSSLLLIHDLNSSSSSYEWSNVIEQLSKTHTVYAIDLLGCGVSEKVNITYTNYMYVQLICDFVKDVIRKKTDVIASSLSCSIAVMSCFNDSSLFNRIILVNPVSLAATAKIPGRHSKFLRILLNTPIIGTLIYNLTHSRKNIADMFSTSYFANKSHIKSEYINAYYESAHFNGSNSRFVNSSRKGNYTTANVNNAIRKINNSIIIVGGSTVPDINRIITEYTLINPSIESVIINQAGILPHLEVPNRFLKTIAPYIAEIPD